MTQAKIVDAHGNCSLCSGTHYGTGYYYCPYECSRCRVNTEQCFQDGCPRNARWQSESREQPNAAGQASIPARIGADAEADSPSSKGLESATSAVADPAPAAPYDYRDAIAGPLSAAPLTAPAAPISSEKLESDTPRCDDLERNELDSNDIRAWRALARAAEGEYRQVCDELAEAQGEVIKRIDRLGTLIAEVAKQAPPALAVSIFAAAKETPVSAMGQSDTANTPLTPTPEMIEAGAQRLVRWETGDEKWPDAWSKLNVRAARNDAERCWRSMWLAATDNSKAG